MVFVEAVRDANRVQVNAANRALEDGQWHTDQRAHLGGDEAFYFSEAAAARDIRSEDRQSLLEDAMRDGPAYADGPVIVGIAIPAEYRGELLAVCSIEQNRSAFRRSHFKSQVENLRLQLIQIADRMHDAADFEESIQIPCQPRGGRQLAENLLRLQIQNVLRADLCRGVRRLLVLELHHPAGTGPDRLIVSDEEEDGVSNRNFIEVFQLVFRDGFAVDQSAVAAFEVFDRVAVAIAANKAVPS